MAETKKALLNESQIAKMVEGVVASIKALDKKHSVVKFAGREIICDVYNSHDLSRKNAGKTPAFSIVFKTSENARWTVTTQATNAVYHPEQAGMYWAKAQCGGLKVLLGVFDKKGNKVAECVPYVKPSVAIAVAAADNNLVPM